MNFGLFLLCGSMAGASASFWTNPLDIVKLRLQVQRSGSAHVDIQYNHMGDGLVKLFKHEGLRGLFRGVGARMAFHAPATALTMTFFEQLKIFLADE